MATITYKAQSFNQFHPQTGTSFGKLVYFHATARDIKTWAGVPRKGWTLRALYQRVLDETRLEKIQSFLSPTIHGRGNLSPTAVTIAIRKGEVEIPEAEGSFDLTFNVPPPPSNTDEDLASEIARLAAIVHPQHINRLDNTTKQALIEYHNGSLALEEVPAYIDSDDYIALFTFEMMQLAVSADDFLRHQSITTRKEQLNLLDALYELSKPALIVDGQHRIMGGALVNNCDVQFLVCCLPGCSWSDQAFQFVVINEEAKPVDKTILYDIFGSSLTREESDVVRKQLGAAGRSIEKKIAAAVAARDLNSPFLNMVQLNVDDIPPGIDPYLSPRLIVDLIEGNRGVRGFRTNEDFMRVFVAPARPNEDGIEWWRDWETGAWRNYWYAFWRAVRDYFNSNHSEIWSQLKGKRTNLTMGVALKAFQTVILDEIIRHASTTQAQRLSLLKLGIEEDKVRQLLSSSVLPPTAEDFYQYVTEKFLTGFPAKFFTRPWQKSLDTSSGLEVLTTVMRETWSSYVGEGGSGKYPYWKNSQIFSV